MDTEVLSEPASRGQRGPYRKGVRRRQEIVDAASAVFAEFGYSGGSVRTIAERVGVSPATLIQYFGSKEGLLTAVLEDWSDRIHRLSVDNVRGLASINRLRQVMRYHVDHRGLIELFVTMSAEASSLTHPARSFVQNRYATELQKIAAHFSEAVEAGEIGQLSETEIEQEASMLFAVMDGLELQWLLDPTVDLVGLFDRYLDAAIERWRAG